jgi:hypothetical protein
MSERGVSGRADITTAARTVEEWGIRFWDAELGEFREVTFSKDYAMKYLGDDGVEVVRRERIITPDRVTGWRVIPPGASA